MCPAASVAQLPCSVLTAPHKATSRLLFLRTCFLLLVIGRFNQVLLHRNLLQHSRAIQPSSSELLCWLSRASACMNVLGRCRVAHRLSWISTCPWVALGKSLSGSGLLLHEQFRCPVPDWPHFWGPLGGDHSLNLTEVPSGLSYSQGRTCSVPGKQVVRGIPKEEQSVFFLEAFSQLKHLDCNSLYRVSAAGKAFEKLT